MYGLAISDADKALALDPENVKVCKTFYSCAENCDGLRDVSGAYMDFRH
jgi:hypothetical protein